VTCILESVTALELQICMPSTQREEKTMCSSSIVKVWKFVV